jgi:hypothetical protein
MEKYRQIKKEMKELNITCVTVANMPAIAADEFNKEKFKQIIHYIIACCGNNENVGKTVLYKLAYFSDFDYYELNESKMSGEAYRNIQRGPAPIHFEEVIRELETEGKVLESKRDYFNYGQFKYTSKVEPVVSLLSDKELNVINGVIKKHSCKSGSELSDLSHDDMPYKATKPSDIIDYELVFYRDEVTSVRVYEEDD